MAHQPFKIALIFGGPSNERGISLNSARSVMDHLSADNITLLPLYVDQHTDFYEISPAQLYSNTPSDFDFKLDKNAQHLSEAILIEKLRAVDITFPVIHGAFGEDGVLQSFLEQHNIPYVGPSSQTCRQMFHKSRAATHLKNHGFDTIASALLEQANPKVEQMIIDFFANNPEEAFVVKPVAGGSSIGIFVARSSEEAFKKFQKLGEDAIIEPFCKGKEFTVIVLQNMQGEPIAMIPSGIEINYENGQIFDFRRKYLPTNSTQSPCPPNFSDAIVADIQQKAETIFKLFGIHDFSRLDGWLLDDGRLIFSDLNPISGMDQNSFIFQQCSRIGLSHKETLYSVLLSACNRQGITPPVLKATEATSGKDKVHVLFGGKTAERQVSLMSGTNIWLKLRNASKYQAEPYLLDLDGAIWYLPYSYTLNHTVEEVYENCTKGDQVANRIYRLAQQIYKKWDQFDLRYNPKEHIPKRYTFEAFIEKSKQNDAFIFLGLHGGDGENGHIQQRLDQAGLTYNGSDPVASKLCMDKHATAQGIKHLNDDGVISAPKQLLNIKECAAFSHEAYQTYWTQLKETLQSESFIIKPVDDGCSAGIIRLFTAKDLKTYVDLVQTNAIHILPNTFKNQPVLVEMPQAGDTNYMLEAFIETDQIYAEKNQLIYKQKQGWLELTVGILERAGEYHSLAPSITVSDNEVLSLEEKFQGGTGVNITPPPQNIISAAQVALIKQKNEQISKTLGIKNYARNDIFFNVISNQVLLIEANSLPGLTPSTVIYHQALAEASPMNPTHFLETIIDYKKAKDCCTITEDIYMVMAYLKPLPALMVNPYSLKNITYA